MELNNKRSQLCLHAYVPITHVSESQPRSTYVLGSGGSRGIKMDVIAALMASRTTFEESQNDFDSFLEK